MKKQKELSLNEFKNREEDSVLLPLIASAAGLLFLLGCLILGGIILLKTLTIYFM